MRDEEMPGTVKGAVVTTWLLVAALGVSVLLTGLLEEELIRAWARGTPAARAVLEEGGIDALENASVEVPSFLPVAIVSFVLVLIIAWVLLALLKGPSAGGARIGMSMIVLLGVLMAVFSLFRYAHPPLFLVTTIVVLVMEVVLLVLLWLPATTDWVRRGSHVPPQG